MGAKSQSMKESKKTMKLSFGRRGLAVVGGVAASLALASVAVGAGPTYNLKKLKGSITADGSSTVGPMRRPAPSCSGGLVRPE